MVFLNEQKTKKKTKGKMKKRIKRVIDLSITLVASAILLTMAFSTNSIKADCIGDCKESTQHVCIIGDNVVYDHKVDWWVCELPTESGG